MIIQFIMSYKYAAVFIGLLLGGETVLLPVIYFATKDVFNIVYVWIISLVATALSDSVWYYIGRTFPAQRLTQIRFIKKHEGSLRSLSGRFKTHGLFMVFLSKFVYGTRVAAQLLAGATRIPFAQYFVVNMAGVIALNALFTALAYSVSLSLSQFEDYTNTLEIGLAAFIVLALLLHIIIKRLFSHKWFR